MKKDKSILVVPDGWLTKTIIVKRIKYKPSFVRNRLDELTASPSQSHGVFNYRGVDRKFYSQMIFNQIREEVDHILKVENDKKKVVVGMIELIKYDNFFPKEDTFSYARSHSEDTFSYRRS